MLLRILTRFISSSPRRFILSSPRRFISSSSRRFILSSPRRRGSTIKTLCIFTIYMDSLLPGYDILRTIYHSLSRLAITIYLLSTLFISSTSYAKNNALDAMIINADDVIMDKKTASSIFTGHVVLWFDNGLIIETDKVILTIKEENNKKSIDRIIMPSKIRAIRDGEGIRSNLSETTLIASSAEYIENESELRLKGDIYIQDNDNFVKCNELIYYTHVEKVKNE